MLFANVAGYRAHMCTVTRVGVNMQLLAGKRETEPIDEPNGPITKLVQRVCHDTLPWLISFSLDVLSQATHSRRVSSLGNC